MYKLGVTTFVSESDSFQICFSVASVIFVFIKTVLQVRMRDEFAVSKSNGKHVRV